MSEKDGIYTACTIANHPDLISCEICGPGALSSEHKAAELPASSVPFVPSNRQSHQQEGKKVLSVSSAPFVPIAPAAMPKTQPQHQANKKTLSVSSPPFDPSWRQKLGRSPALALPGSATTSTSMSTTQQASFSEGNATTPKPFKTHTTIPHPYTSPPSQLKPTISQPLTRMLLASGGDMRALLLSDQPLSSLWAQTADTGNEAAGQKIVSKDKDKDKDNEEEKVQEERFVRPPRLRFALSNEAASDGFPSAIALSLRWHPDHMQDRPGDAANPSIRAAFNTKFDEYYVFRHWRPSQGR